MARTPEEKARYRAYIEESPLWKAKRYAAVDVRAGGICEFEIEDGLIVKGVPRMVRCTARAVHCHHLTYAHLYDEPLEDLQALCNLHHKVVHVWARRPKCWCGNEVFDSIEDAIAYVEEDEYRNWDELYDNVPTTCSWCMQVRCKDDELLRRGPYEGQDRQEGRSIERTSYPEQPNGQCPPGPDTRTPMLNNTSTIDVTDNESATDTRDDEIKIIWLRWPNMERMITGNKVKWEYHDAVPLSEIDVPKSRENLARIGRRIVAVNVESMVIQAREHRMLDLPAMVGWRPKGPGTKIVLNDGITRDVALRRLGITHAAMYLLVNPGPIQAETITRQANGLVGLGHTQEQLIEHAIAYFKAHPGCSYAVAAKQNHIHPGLLSQRLKADDLAKRFAADGDLPVPGAGAFKHTVRVNLAMIQNDIVLQHAALQLLTVRGFSHKHAERLQKVVKATKPSTQEAQLAAVDVEIGRQKEELASEKGPQRGPMAKQGLVLRTVRQHLRMLDTTFTPDVNPKDVMFDVDRRAEYVELSKRLRSVQLRIERSL
jgi:hypothetical protein